MKTEHVIRKLNPLGRVPNGFTKKIHVNWTELQVWIGVPLHEKGEVGLFACAPCFDGARRCTRLFRVGEWNAAGVQYTKFKGTTCSSKLADPFPVISSSRYPANFCPEGWEMGGPAGE